MESRSRSVTVPSSRLVKSTVHAKGMPSSSLREYRLPTVAPLSSTRLVWPSEPTLLVMSFRSSRYLASRPMRWSSGRMTSLYGAMFEGKESTPRTCLSSSPSPFGRAEYECSKTENKIRSMPKEGSTTPGMNVAVEVFTFFLSQATCAGKKVHTCSSPSFRLTALSACCFAPTSSTSACSSSPGRASSHSLTPRPCFPNAFITSMPACFVITSCSTSMGFSNISRYLRSTFAASACALRSKHALSAIPTHSSQP
mmetsp:Transcript_68270/g.177693  ORF Transcript_68270/g.177693 Transcript_68270/m.177693 type:complete len:254 (+) Transcript_68270:416-1177(+)